jgi:hypothetical protein
VCEELKNLAVVLVIGSVLMACGGDDDGGECAPQLEGSFVMHMTLTRGDSSVCPAGRPIVVGNDGSMELEPGCAPVETETASCIAQTWQTCERKGCTMEYSSWLDGKGGSWHGEYTAEIVCPDEHASCTYDLEVEDR